MEDSTIEGNRLIAEFMGGVYVENDSLIEVYNKSFDMDNTSFHGVSQNKKNGRKFVKKIRILNLQYDSSWDWQVPVWHKIARISQLRAMDEESATRHNNLCDKYEGAIFQNSPKLGQLIIVEAIQWYNTTKPHPNEQ